MSEKETIEKVKDKQGLLNKIQNVLGSGYATREDLRELDKKLRDFYYADFVDLRHRWEEICLSAVNARTATGDFKKLYKSSTELLKRLTVLIMATPAYLTAKDT